MITLIIQLCIHSVSFSVIHNSSCSALKVLPKAQRKVFKVCAIYIIYTYTCSN